MRVRLLGAAGAQGRTSSAGSTSRRPAFRGSGDASLSATGQTPDVGNQVLDLLISELSAPGRHEGRLPHSGAALLRDLKDVLVLQGGHVLRVGVVAGPGIQGGRRRPVPLPARAVARRAELVIHRLPLRRIPGAPRERRELNDHDDQTDSPPPGYAHVLPPWAMDGHVPIPGAQPPLDPVNPAADAWPTKTPTAQIQGRQWPPGADRASPPGRKCAGTRRPPQLSTLGATAAESRAAMVTSSNPPGGADHSPRDALYHPALEVCQEDVPPCGAAPGSSREALSPGGVEGEKERT